MHGSCGLYFKMVQLILPSEDLTLAKKPDAWHTAAVGCHMATGSPIKQDRVTKCPPELVRANMGCCLDEVPRKC